MLLLDRDAPSSVTPIPISAVPGNAGESVLVLGFGCDATKAPDDLRTKRGKDHTWSTVQTPEGTILDDGWRPCLLDSGAPILEYWQGDSSTARILGVNSNALGSFPDELPPDANPWSYITAAALADVPRYCSEINVVASAWGVNPLPCGVARFLGSDVVASSTQVGWGSYTVDANWVGPGFAIGGVRFSRGIFAHAPSQVTFLLEGKYSTFSACVGQDDGDGSCGNGAQVSVSGDGGPIWSSRIGNGAPVCIPPRDLTAVRELTLQADSLGDRFCDEVEWVNTVVQYRSTTTPRTTSCEGRAVDACRDDCAWYACAGTEGACFPTGTPNAQACPLTHLETCAATGTVDSCTGDCAWYWCAHEGAGACLPRGTPSEMACPPSPQDTCAAIGVPDLCAGGCAWYWCARGGAGACFPRGTPNETACP